MSDSEGGNSDSPVSNIESFPTPQISDLLVLTLSVSFVFALNAPSYQDELKLYTIGWRDLLPVLFDDFVKGLCLFGVMVVWRQFFRQSRFCLEPGHVALLTMAPYEIAGLIFGVFYPFMELNQRPIMRAFHYGVYACFYAASLIYPLRKIRKLDFWWRVCLYLLTASIAAASLACVLDAAIELKSLSYLYRRHFSATIGNLDVLIMLTTYLAVAIDWNQRKRRDWLHYAGVLTLLLHTTAALMHWERSMRLWWQWLLNQLLP